MGHNESTAVLVSLQRNAYKPGDTICGNVSFDGEDGAVSSSKDLVVQVWPPVCGRVPCCICLCPVASVCGRSTEFSWFFCNARIHFSGHRR